MNPFLPHLTAPTAMNLPSGATVQVPTCFVRFEPWRGEPVPTWVGNKAQLDYQGEPLYAELLILRVLQREGWEGAWVDGFHRQFRTGLPIHHMVRDLPGDKRALLSRIARKPGFPSGCWDVFAW